MKLSIPIFATWLILAVDSTLADGNIRQLMSKKMKGKMGKKNACDCCTISGCAKTLECDCCPCPLGKDCIGLDVCKSCTTDGYGCALDTCAPCNKII